MFYVNARLAAAEIRFDDAEHNIAQAIKIAPHDADFFAFYAQIKLLRKQFSKATELADKALEIDAENILALNVRSTSLLKLQKKDESFETIENALRMDPENAYTHSNYGWNLLEKGDYKKARTHFEEALKANPNLDFAQAGMLESIKAGNPFYRLFLNYSFWIGNLQSKGQWAFIIGFT